MGVAIILSRSPPVYEIAFGITECLKHTALLIEVNSKAVINQWRGTFRPKRMMNVNPSRNRDKLGFIAKQLKRELALAIAGHLP